MEKARGASAAKIELDPWLTESRVVSAHKALHATQVGPIGHIEHCVFDPLANFAVG